MPERVTTGYKRLFEVRVLHHYWLDDGATVFDLVADQQKRDGRLLSYDVRQFLTVRPTPAAEKGLSAYRCLFRETPLGLVVATPAAAIIPPDTVFEFVIAVAGSRFYDFTSMTLRPQKIYELYNKADAATYRYKENVPVLSNLTGTTRGAGANKSLFLSQEIPALDANAPVESLALSGGELWQLTSDGPAATTQKLAALATDLPVYVNQSDAPAIVVPPGLVGAPTRGVRLSADVADDTFALISLTAARPSDDAFSFVDAAGAAKSPAPVYQIRFKNRSTVWKYRNNATGAVVSTEATPFPLTYFGNAGTKQKPSENSLKVETTGAKITRLVSEIYV